ncbi:MAG: DUF523 domain-containing protein [Clostridiales bacterium]|jgi:uncharacterized protein YbbK (DUF523 family)|nr:DUF523 domain-containing protein [Clostridiales bacterium]
MLLVSACLVGINCKYNGGNNYVPEIADLVKQGKAVPLCPEQLGGLPTPRIPVEIKGGSAEDVLKGTAVVIRKDGTDVTSNFIKGAIEVLRFCKDNGIELAILKSRSPSCGKGSIYDGTFSGRLIDGDGIAAYMLMDNGIHVITENDAVKYLAGMKENNFNCRI